MNKKYRLFLYVAFVLSIFVFHNNTVFAQDLTVDVSTTTIVIASNEFIEPLYVDVDFSAPNMLGYEYIAEVFQKGMFQDTLVGEFHTDLSGAWYGELTNGTSLSPGNYIIRVSLMWSELQEIPGGEEGEPPMYDIFYHGTLPGHDYENGDYAPPITQDIEIEITGVGEVLTNLGFGTVVQGVKDPSSISNMDPQRRMCEAANWKLTPRVAGYLKNLTIDDPVDIVSGNFLRKNVDLEFKARLPINIIRVYNSLSSTKTPFGIGWFSPVFTSLKEVTDEPLYPDMLFTNSDGSMILFKYVDGVYSGGEGVKLKLEYSGSDDHWILTNPGVAQWEFDESGEILSKSKLCCGGVVTDAVTYSYRRNGKLKEITNSAGQWVKFKYNSNNFIKKIIDSSGRKLIYKYTSDGHLKYVKDPIGRVTRYYYNNNGQLNKIKEPGNKIIKISYLNKKVKKIRNADGSSWKIEWKTNKRKTIVTDQAGTVHKYKFSPEGQIKNYKVPSLGIEKEFISSGSALIGFIDSKGRQKSFTYNAEGLLDRIIDKEGNTTTYEYHPTLHKLTKKTDTLGRIWEYEWCSRGNLISSTDPAGNKTTYTYDDHNNRTSVTNALGQTTRYVYDSSGSYLIKTIDPASGTISFTYDNRGNLLTATDALSRVTSFEYDLLDRLTKTIYPDGQFVVITYDEAGNIITRKDNIGRETHYTYDLADRLISVVYPDGTTTTYTYDNAGRKTSSTDQLGRVTQYKYDAIGNLIKTIYPDGTYKTYSYDTERRLISKTDELGNTTSFEYDPMGRLLATIDPAGSRWENQYDIAGRKIAEKDPLGRTTQYINDKLDRVIKTIYPDFAQASFNYDAVGNLVSSTDAMGNTTVYDYDNLNRKIRTTEPNGASYTTVFDPAGQVVSKIDPLGATNNYTYDLGGRVLTATDALGNQWNYEYDSAGRLIKAVNPINASYTISYDVMDRPVFETNALGGVTHYEYDVAGRRISITDPMGYRSLTAYDLRDRVVSQVDPEGRIVSFGYDEAGRRIRLTEGAGRTYQYEFDNLGRKIAVIDPLGNRTAFAYDAVGNLMTKTNARAQATAYDYDVVNNLVKVTYPDASIATFSYDLNDRELVRSSNFGAAIKTWDAVGNLTSETFQPINKGWKYKYDLAGNRIKATSPEGKKLTYKYDKLSRLTKLKASKYDKLSYKYDALGRLNKIVRPNVKTIYKYDIGSNLLKIKHIKPSHRKNKVLAERKYAYDLDGNRVSVKDEEDRVTNYSYDRANWLNKVVYPNAETFAYTYNGAGDRTSETIQKLVKKWTRKRHRKQCTVETQTNTIDYAYDSAGRMVARGSDSYEYDNDGNLVRAIEGGEESLFGWNSDNRLVKAEKIISDKHFTKRAVEEYEYLPEDWRRISRLGYTSFNYRWCGKNHNATTVKNRYYSVYDGEDESHEYWKSPSFMRRSWGWGRHCWKPKLPKYILKREYIGGPYSDDMEISKYHNSSLYMLKDALGSTIALANRDGKNIARIGYDAWGNFRYPSNKNLCRPFNSNCLPGFINRLAHTRGLGKSSHNPWAMGKYFAAHLSPYLYAGRKYNQFTRQYFNRNRFYQPKYGRFTSKDPSGFKYDINLYRYANDNPLRYIDANGKFAILAPLFAGFALGLAIGVIALTDDDKSRLRDSIQSLLDKLGKVKPIDVNRDLYGNYDFQCPTFNDPFEQYGDNIILSESGGRGAGDNPNLRGGTGEPDPNKLGGPEDPLDKIINNLIKAGEALAKDKDFLKAQFMRLLKRFGPEGTKPNTELFNSGIRMLKEEAKKRVLGK